MLIIRLSSTGINHSLVPGAKHPSMTTSTVNVSDRFSVVDSKKLCGPMTFHGTVHSRIPFTGNGRLSE
jgi:hypothetical protein